MLRSYGIEDDIISDDLLADVHRSALDWDKWDTNKDGKISITEFKSIAPKNTDHEVSPHTQSL